MAPDTRTGERAGRRLAGRGFTLIEMLIVVALVGIVATLAMPSYRHATLKAREAVLREDLWTFRDVIDQFYTDKGRYPTSLEELVSTGYLRMIPIDPFTKEADWTTTTEPLAEGEEEDEDVEPGITDVHSNAPGTTEDGIPYSEL
jgi:general secretion pathway protein G